MKKFLSVLIVLILVLTSGLVLVSCVKDKDKDKDEDKGGQETTKSVMDIFNVLDQSMADNAGTISSDIGLQAKVGVQDYYIGIRMNSPVNVSDFELVFDVRMNNREGEIVFATYIVDGKIYFAVGDNLKFYIDDFDMDFIIDLLRKIPGIDSVLDAILANIEIAGSTLLTKDIIDLLSTLLFAEPKYEEIDGVKTMSFDVVVSSFLETILGMVTELNLEGLLEGVFNLDTSNSNKPLTDFLMTDIMQLIKDYPFDIKFNATIAPGQTPNMVIDWKNKNTGNNIIKVTPKIGFYDEPQDIGLPEDLKTDYEDFSVFNLGFDMSFGANVGGKTSMELDLTSLINLFAGSDYEDFIPKDVPLTLTLGEMGVNASFQIQLDRYDNSNNLLAIEFRLLKSLNPADRDQQPIVMGLYYIDNMFYLKLNINDNNNGLFAPVIKFSGIDISQIMNSIFEGGEIIDGMGNFIGMRQLLTDLVLDMIKPKGEAPAPEASQFNSQSFNSLSNYSSDSRFMNLIYKALGIFHFDKQLLAKDPTGFGLNFYNDKESGRSFFKDLCKLIPSIGNIQGMDSELFADFGGSLRFNYGDANVDSGGNKNTLANIELKVGTMYKGSNIDFNMLLDDFRLGAPDNSFYDYIFRELENQETADNLKELISNIADGAKLSTGLEIKLYKGEIDINKILAPLNIPGMPNLPKLRVEKDITLKFRLDLQMAYVANAPSTSKLRMELILESVLDAAGNSAESFFPYLKVGTPAIGIYSVDGGLYVDLSGITIANLALPKIAAKVDIMSMIAEQLDKISLDFTLNDIIALIKGEPTSTESQSYNSNGINAIDYSKAGGANISITTEKVSIYVTSMAIVNLLKHFTGDQDFNLPNFDINIDLLSKEHVFKLDANLKDDDSQTILGLSFYVNDFSIGKNDPEFNASFNDFDTSLYESNIMNIAKQLLKSVDIRAEFDMKTRGDVLNITSLINNLLAIAEIRLDFPIELDLANFDDSLQMILKWNLSDNPRDSELLFEIYSKKGQPTAANGYKASGLFLGIYAKDGDLNLDLSQLGVTKLKYSNFDLNATVDMILEEAIKLTGLDSSQLDLSTILGDLLAGLVPSTDDLSSFSGNYLNVNASNTLNNASIGNTLVDSLLGAILDNLSISGGQIILDLMSKVLENGDISSPIKDIFYELGIGAGIDIGAGASIDLKNSQIKLDALLQNTEFGVTLTLKGIGKGDAIDWQNKNNEYWVTRDPGVSNLPENYKFSTFADVSNTSLFEVLMNVFSNVTGDAATTAPNGWKSLITIDLKIFNNANGTFNNSDTQYTYLEILKAIQPKNDYDFNFAKGDFMIRLYNVAADGSGRSEIAVIHFDVKASKLLLKLRKGLGLPDFILGFVPDIGIDLPLGDLKAILPDFSIPTIGGNSSVKSNSYSAEAAAFGIDSLLDAQHGISIAIGNNNDVKIKANAKGDFISNMINEGLKGLFGDTMDGVENKPFVYDAKTRDHGEIVDDIYNKFLCPFIDNMVSPGISGMLAAWSDNIKNVIRRILPLPMFSEMTLEANINQGAFSDLKVRAYDSLTQRDADIASDRTENLGIISIDIINAVVSQKKGGVNIDWMNQSTDIIYVVDKFGTEEKSKLKENFVAKAWNNAPTYVNGNFGSTILNSASINFGTTAYTRLEKAMESETEFNKFVADPTNNVTRDGDSYIYNFNIETNEFRYGKIKEKLPVKITIIPKLDVKRIEDVYITAADKQPVYAADGGNGTLTTDVVLLYGDNFERLSVKRTITDIQPKGKAQANGDIIVTGIVNGVDVNIVYLNENTDKFTANANIVDSEKSMLKEVLDSNKGNIKNVPANSLAKISTLPKVAYFKYDSSPVWRSAIIESWDLTEVYAKINDSGFMRTSAVATLVGGVKVKYNFNIISDTVKNISFGGEDDILMLDPLEYWNPNNWTKNQSIDVDKNGVYNKILNKVFSTKASVEYLDGRIVVEDIVWDQGTLTTFINNYEKSSLIKEQVYNDIKVTSAKNSWYRGDTTIVNGNTTNVAKNVKIKVMSRENPYLIFGKDEEGFDSYRLKMNPYDNVNTLLNRTATAVYDDNTQQIVMMSPASDDNQLPSQGGYLNLDVNIRPLYYDKYVGNNQDGEYVINENLITKVAVPVVVEKCVINDLSSSANILLNDVSRFNYRKSLTTGAVDSIVSLLPQDMYFNVNGNQKAKLDVVYSDNYAIGDGEFINRLSDYNNMYAQEITVQFRIANGVDTEVFPYQIKVKIPNRIISSNTKQQPITVTYEDYITKANHGISNKVAINYNEDINFENNFETINIDTKNFNFDLVNLLNDGENKGYVTIRLNDNTKVNIPLIIKNCPKDVPVSVANGYNILLFNKKEYFDNQNNGNELLNYTSKYSKVDVLVMNGTGTKIKTYTGNNIKWEFANIKPDVDNQTVTLKVYDDNKNLIAQFKVSIKFV